MPAFPRYRGARTADVVIVGGGLTGCATAYVCAAAGLSAVLLERGSIGLDATSRSAGLLTPDPGPTFREVAGDHGARTARRVFEAWRRGALEGAALVRRLGLKCHLEPRGVVIAGRREHEKDLQREFEARREAGLGVSWLNQRQLQSLMKLDAAAGIRLRDGFALDPYRACAGFAAAAAKRNAGVFERSTVKKIRFTRKHADVIADQGTIRTRAVVIATGTATPLFSPLRRHLKRREKYFAVTERVPAAVRRQLGDPRMALADMWTPPHRVRWVPGDRLLVAGADQDETPERKRAAILAQRTGQLMYELSTMYPDISGMQPEYGWEAPYAEAADRLMYIGAHRNYPHHLFALGGQPDSLTGSFVAARVLLRAVQKTPDKADEVFSWTR
jgi:glycine/D-amino acid oxidase-like deaminating enzyme